MHAHRGRRDQILVNVERAKATWCGNFDLNQCPQYKPWPQFKPIDLSRAKDHADIFGGRVILREAVRFGGGVKVESGDV